MGPAEVEREYPWREQMRRPLKPGAHPARFSGIKTSGEPPPFQAVTFDVGGTLLTPWPSVGSVYADVAAHHGYPGISPARLNQRFAAAWRRLKRFRYTRSAWAALVDTTFGPAFRPPPSRTFFPQLWDRFAEPEAWRIFADVRPTLDHLAARGCRLGIVSNWDERLRPLLRALQLDKYFEIIVISCEAGAAKPSRRVFRLASQQFRLPPSVILHVGDSLRHDYTGALKAGFQARLLRRAAGRRGQEIIASLRMLPGLERRQNRGAPAPASPSPDIS